MHAAPEKEEKGGNNEKNAFRPGSRRVPCGRPVGSCPGNGSHQSDRPAADLHHVSGDLYPAAELERYTQKAIAEKLIDQQVRDIDIGKARIGIGMVHRGRLEKPAPDSVAEHDQISEVYHVISGSAILVEWI